MTSQPIRVGHQRGSYPVYVESGILSRLTELAQQHLPRRVALIADATVFELFKRGSLGVAAWSGTTLQVPSGEASKTRESWARLSDELLEHGFGRDTGLISLGGGMVGDLTGFVAATYMRGVPYALAPTTLLAMVDASVGGKTGVNTAQGKNLIGAFYPPVAVMADPQTLSTLPDREYRGGLAEAVKHGLIADRSYFEWIESAAEAILGRDPSALAHLVRRSVEIKAEVVSHDERESGRRAILNAGHTVAHALESASDYRLSHGEAVALGLVAEAALAERIGVAESGLAVRVRALLERLGLPVRLPESLDYPTVLRRMSVDKKNRNTEVHCALASGLGRMYSADGSWTIPISPGDLEIVMGTLSGR
ncbi:MAG: 3-dehydroquinate synthase [Gemmatimonadales bacterium]